VIHNTAEWSSREKMNPVLSMRKKEWLKVEAAYSVRRDTT
jgi:hypothetical protein